jgi:hypothetical protein
MISSYRIAARSRTSPASARRSWSGRPAQAASEPTAPAAKVVVPASKAPTAVIPDRFTAYIFDDVHMRRGDLAQVREAVWKHMQESGEPIRKDRDLHYLAPDLRGLHRRPRQAVYRALQD